MKRLLILTPAPVTAASTRFRLVQFFPALRANGIEPILRPFLDDEGFRVLYGHGRSMTKLRSAARAIANRIVDVVRSTAADAVLIHREAALIGPPIIEWILARIVRRPIIFDLDDAIWVPYSSPTYGALLSRLLKMPWKTNFTLAAARHVITGNPYISSYASQFGQPVDVIPTVVDTAVFRPEPRRVREQLTIGWIGTHSSAQYLRALVPALRELSGRRRFILRVVGARLDEPGLPVNNVPWTIEREVEEFQSLDIGIYPLVEDAWSLGKSGFKAVQYMACGVPVVASPVGVTRDIVRDGANGFLACNDTEWVARLEALLDDVTLRRRLGEAGRVDAVAHWSLATHAPRFVELVRTSLETRG